MLPCVSPKLPEAPIVTLDPLTSRISPCCKNAIPAPEVPKVSPGTEFSIAKELPLLSALKLTKDLL